MLPENESACVRREGMMTAFVATILSLSPHSSAADLWANHQARSGIFFSFVYTFIVSADITGHYQIARGSAVRM